MWEVLGHSLHTCRNKRCTCMCSFSACKDRICLLETQAMLRLALQRCWFGGRPADGKPVLIPYTVKGARKLPFSRMGPRCSNICYFTNMCYLHPPGSVRKSPSQKIPPCSLTKHKRLYFLFPARGGESKQVPLKKVSSRARLQENWSGHGWLVFPTHKKLKPHI